MAIFRKFAQEKVYIFEFGTHFHVVPPWIKIYNGLNAEVFLPREYMPVMRRTLEEYGLNSKVSPIEKISWKILLARLFGNNSDRIIISTAREFLFTKKEFISFLILWFVRPNIVCIRNPNSWVIEKMVGNWVHRTNGKWSIKIRRAIANNAEFVIGESNMQVSFINNHILRANSKSKCFSFPGRLSDVYPRSIYLNSKKNASKVLNIGLLGSVDSLKRDYLPLIDFLLDTKSIERPKLTILGSTLPKGADQIINDLNELTTVIVPITKRLTESEFFKLGIDCDLLLAPLRTDRGYGANFGTGSMADAILLRKYILIPKEIETDCEMDLYVLRYQSAGDLQTILGRDSTTFLIDNNQEIFTTDWLKAKLN